MKNKILYCINFIWTSFVAFSFPICFAWIYLDITGHSKGYGYDLGSEKDISIMVGCVELLFWLALALPSNIYIFRKTLEVVLIGVCTRLFGRIYGILCQKTLPSTKEACGFLP